MNAFQLELTQKWEGINTRLYEHYILIGKLELSQALWWQGIRKKTINNGTHIPALNWKDKRLKE